MRSRTAFFLALLSIVILGTTVPSDARPIAAAQQQQQQQKKQNAKKPEPGRVVAQQHTAHAPRSNLDTARDLLASARSRAVPALVAEARKYIGTNPTERKRLWCATFMNFVLARLGYEGTNSDAAKSFAQYGERIHEPRVGAIAVLTRGRKGGHVGVVSGVDADGNPIIISGNHTPKGVGEGVYARSRVIAYVVPKERRTIAQNARAAGPSIESPFAELIAAMKTEQARAQRPQPAAPAAPVVRRAAPPVVPHRTVQQTPDQRANNGATNPLSELMGSLERAPVRQRVL